ncbi:hypothetical protein [Anaerocellum danielii]|uniref:Type II secretion system protein GspF domain-containing protein n=1 Tax=Anaerocellum danielii TaxID=1387557 RepID=A0ABZ0TXJ0_9FIRM|nr:hypothetical protein [Caldicellulosiruptor danielii]WPX08166.1 hypothetical protein SOJ16_002032 [Caldicellulosiruptor danielii]
MHIDIVAGILSVIQVLGIAVAVTAGISAVTVYRINNRIQPVTARIDKIQSKIQAILTLLMGIAGFFASAWWTGSYPLAIIGAVGFGALGYAMPTLIVKSMNKKVEKYLTTIATLFEIGIKSNVPLEKVFHTCAATIKHKKLSEALKRAGAVYIKTRDIDQALSEVETIITTPELKLFKTALKEVEKVGTSALVSLETFTNMQNLRANDYLSRRKESVTTYSTVAVAIILFAAMMVYFAPIYRLIMQSMIQFFQ